MKTWDEETDIKALESTVYWLDEVSEKETWINSKVAWNEVSETKTINYEFQVRPDHYATLLFKYTQKILFSSFSTVRNWKRNKQNLLSLLLKHVYKSLPRR